MLNTFKLILITLCVLIISSCGNNQDIITNPDDTDPLLFGKNETLDIITWNLREFPWQGQITLDALAQIIPRFKADVVAFQEINDFGAFNSLAALLPDYEAIVYTATSSYRLAYIYNPETVTLVDEYTIFDDQSNPFPRPPYIFHLQWMNEDYYLINNHLKAFGDNFIDENDDWDEEVRRRLACQLLDQYISSELPLDKVVVMGDMNDQIQEPEEYNVFSVFLNSPSEYLFASMPMAMSPSFNTVSYPNSNSQIDHIMITNELFTDYETAGEVCKSIQVEKYYGSWTNYTDQISDHRPVGIRLGLAVGNQ